MMGQTITVDSMLVELEGEPNLLEVIRKAGIELPTFCYHSNISIYGACRMCMVEVEGVPTGITPACSTKPTAGMVVRTNTKQIRDMRKMIIELTLASHDESCTTCSMSGDCRLQFIAKQLGVKTNRFKKMQPDAELDYSSPAVARDPGKCILCGDCVRFCSEVQQVGTLDFAYRGAQARVVTYNNKDIGEVECVGCGQCARICPVGALTIKSDVDRVWKAIDDPEKIVVAQIAPAVRVAIGEYFHEPPGINNTGKMVSALKMMGFDRVYDMCYSADFTVVEEGNEFLRRYVRRENLPLYTSCCPAWVKYAEQFHCELLDNLSTAKSPMSMFSVMCKEQLMKDLGIPRDKIVMVCIAPCTAKKIEAGLDKLTTDGNPDTDLVITTEELAQMIKEHGMEFEQLEVGPLDMPMSFATGGAVIFGNTGGVSEAVLRFAAAELTKGPVREFKEFRGSEGIKTGEVEIGDVKLRLAVVSGLGNAKKLIEKVQSGEETYDIIEVMACPGGCVNGGGQPVHFECDMGQERAKGLFDTDRKLQFHVSSENPVLQQLYKESMSQHRAHELLHTKYDSQRSSIRDGFVLSEATGEIKLVLEICFCKICYQHGAQELYLDLMKYVRDADLEDKTEFKATFCNVKCGTGAVLTVNGKVLENCTYQKAIEAIEMALI